MSMAEAFLLFFISTSGVPALSPVASYADEAACVSAKEASIAALGDAQTYGTFVCLASADFDELGDKIL